jgi:hypothetical protein
MKKLLTVLALVCGLHPARAVFISSYPNTNSWQPTDVFIFERPGVTNYNITMAQMAGAIGAQRSLGTSNLLGNVAPFAGMTTTYTTNGNGVVTETLGNGNVLTNGSALDASKLSGPVPQGLVPFALTNLWKGSLENDGSFSNAGPASFTGPVTNFADVFWRAAIAETGKSNFVLFDSTGKAKTNDWATFVASITSGVSQTPWLSAIDGNNKGLNNAQYLGMTNNGHAGVIVLSPAFVNIGPTYSGFQFGNTTNGASCLSAVVADAFFGATFATNIVGAVARATNADVATFISGPLTNVVTWSNPGQTNIAVVFSNSLQIVTLTNAPKDVFFTFSMASGCNAGSFSALCPTNTTIHLPYPVKWFAGMSNSVVTNGTIEFDSYGGTNYGQLWVGIGEGT